MILISGVGLLLLTTTNRYGRLFLTALLKLELALLISLIFIACMLALIVSLTAFIQDIHLSLVALRLELEGATKE